MCICFSCMYPNTCKCDHRDNSVLMRARTTYSIIMSHDHFHNNILLNCIPNDIATCNFYFTVQTHTQSLLCMRCDLREGLSEFAVHQGKDGKKIQSIVTFPPSFPSAFAHDKLPFHIPL